jgi:hypothetical protein
MVVLDGLKLENERKDGARTFRTEARAASAVRGGE